MKIETKYDIGQHIWIAYEGNGEVCVYDDYIVEISVDKNNDTMYFGETCPEEIQEANIILYEDTDKLVNTIKDIMKQIREKEDNENT